MLDWLQFLQHLLSVCQLTACLLSVSHACTPHCCPVSCVMICIKFIFLWYLRLQGMEVVHAQKLLIDLQKSTNAELESLMKRDRCM